MLSRERASEGSAAQNGNGSYHHQQMMSPGSQGMPPRHQNYGGGQPPPPGYPPMNMNGHSPNGMQTISHDGLGPGGNSMLGTG